MSPHAFTEDQFVEQPAIGLFADLGWRTVSAMEEAFGSPSPQPSAAHDVRMPRAHGSAGAAPTTGGGSAFLGRETKSDVVLVARLRAALTRLNPSLSVDAINTAIDELTRDRSAMSLEAANREVYLLLKEGVRVSVADGEGPAELASSSGRGKKNKSPSPQPSAAQDVRMPRVQGSTGAAPAKGRSKKAESKENDGGQSVVRVRIIDWEQPLNNDYLLVSQCSVTGALYTCRPDLVGFVNGLPLVVVELKKPGVAARVGFDENLTHYKKEIPALFWFNALMIASNGTDSRVGSLTADWERYFEWKRIEREDEPRRVSMEVMIRGTCEKSRLLDLMENFTLFSELKAGLAKIVGQNHQYLGVNNAIASMLAARAAGHGRGGVFWQTQGSGKSFSMVFFAQKVLRKLTGNWTFVVITDRIELDDQIAKTFKAAGAVSEAESKECHASSGAKLRELLRGNHRYVFSLIHKFQTPEMLSDRSDVIVLTDEAHRSQYDTLAVNMRSALPNAMFLAFTGTPLIAGEERTKEVFGDYVSIYDFQQSVEDGATVPLFYENRTPELQLINPDLNDDIYNAIEAADLNPDQEAKLERELSRQYHLITRDERLEVIAQDIVRHFLGRGFQGKGMVVSIDKATALRMYDKVQKYWAAEKKSVKDELASYGLTIGRRDELQARLKVLETTDMAVIVSAAQNEIAQMKKLGLDIEPHRKRMNESDPGLDERFKDTADPLRLVFVCAMWLTGFDAPSCSTVYLDKPMRNHTLMQTIARANRVFPGKHSGLIVDYANVFASLEKALAIYGAGKDGHTPLKDKKSLVAELRAAVEAATTFCSKKGVALKDMMSYPAGGMERLNWLTFSVDALISPDQVRRDYLAHYRLIDTLYKAVKPDPVAAEFAEMVACLALLASEINRRLNPNPPDISKVMTDINAVLDISITGASIPDRPGALLDLSKIDFQALANRFAQSKTKNTDLEMLKAAIRAHLERMIQLNRTRADYQDKFEALIESYNNGSRSIEDLFRELVALTRALSDEEQRHVRENMTEEELVIFDILMRPAPELSTEERAEVKKVATELLTKIKQLLVLNWRQKSSARSQVKLAIEDVLDTGLPRAFTPELYQQKCSALFEHLYESYPERNAGVYTSQAM